MPVSVSRAAAEIAHPTRLPALGAPHVDGIAHQDEADFALGAQAVQGVQIGRVCDAYRFGRPCAVIPRGSLMANPMRFLPRSRARMRVFNGSNRFHYSRQLEAARVVLTYNAFEELAV